MTGNLVFPNLPPGIGIFAQGQRGAASGSATGTVPPLSVPLNNPKISLPNGGNVFCFSADDANRPLRVKASDSNPAADWTTAPYALARVDIAIVSVNVTPVFENGRVFKNNCSQDAQTSGVIITTVLTGADIAALNTILFDVLAKLTFVSGSVRILAGVRVQKN